LSAAASRTRRHLLTPLAEIEDGAARGYRVDLGRTTRRVIVLRQGDGALGFTDSCPHRGIPLPWKDDEYMSPDGRFLRCANHGALFDFKGLCVFGPCKGLKLKKQKLEIVDGEVWLVT
jgi:nitrite reductase/ring-hydroxylating ferredoxin subunit